MPRRFPAITAFLVGLCTSTPLTWVSAAIKIRELPSAHVADPMAGLIETIAGTGERGHAGDGGPAIQARLNEPRGVCVDTDGTLYIADCQNHRIRKVTPDGVIATVVGSGWTDPDGSGRFAGDNGPAVDAHLNWPHGAVLGPDGALYIADMWNHRIRKVDAKAEITTVAGGGAPRDGVGDGGRASEAILSAPGVPALLADGTMYITEWWGHRVRKVDPNGIISTVAGNGTQGYSGDGGPATDASLNGPHGVVVGADGSIYFAEYDNHVIRKVDPAGIITTVAGNGTPGYSGDGGPATQGQLHAPAGLALGPDGSIYIAGLHNHVIRRVSPAGEITTVAGEGLAGYSGDGARANQAAMRQPRAVTVGPDGDLYIADSLNHRIRRVWLRPSDPDQARVKADNLRARIGDLPRIWREVAELYLIAKAWDDALAAAERVLVLTPETDQAARMHGEILAARVWAAKRDDHEARRRLIPILARARDPIVLREAAEALVELYLRRGEREQAIATLNDLRLRTHDWGLLRWIDQRLKGMAGG